jgi:hypothetical protein
MAPGAGGHDACRPAGGMMDLLQPGSWRLDWRDYAGHHSGNARPPASHKRFKSEEGARLELARLRAVPGAVIVGFVSAIPSKPPLATQDDFGWPVVAGPCRMTD